MKNPLFKCHFCKCELDPNADTTYKRVTGWVRNRKAGGANAVAIPGPPTGWACNVCIDIQSGRSPAQQAESLF